MSFQIRPEEEELSKSIVVATVISAIFFSGLLLPQPSQVFSTFQRAAGYCLNLSLRWRLSALSITHSSFPISKQAIYAVPADGGASTTLATFGTPSSYFDGEGSGGAIGGLLIESGPLDFSDFVLRLVIGLAPLR